MKRMTQGKRSRKEQSSIIKGIAVSFTLRAVIATGLCVIFVIYPQLRVSFSKAAYAATDIKSESQYKTEASLYESALRAIAGIATMRLETPDDLKQALAIFDRARPNLKFFSSKLVVIAISDSTFSRAVKKKASSKQAAEALVKELNADPKVVSKLDGAASLTTRLQQSAQEDAAKLRQVAERLKEVAERIKKTNQRNTPAGFGATDEFKLMRVRFNTVIQPVSAANPLVTVPQDVITGFILFAAVVVIILIAYKAFTTPPGRDPFAECIGEADIRYFRCLDEANSLPWPFDLAAKALCAATFFAEEAACLLIP